MVAQLYKSIKTHWTIHLKWVNFMVCNLYCNKVVKKSLIYKTYLLQKQTNPPPPKKKKKTTHTHSSLLGTPVVLAFFKSLWWFPACSICRPPSSAHPGSTTDPEHWSPSLDLSAHALALTTPISKWFPKIYLHPDLFLQLQTHWFWCSLAGYHLLVPMRPDTTCSTYTQLNSSSSP